MSESHGLRLRVLSSGRQAAPTALMRRLTDDQEYYVHGATRRDRSFNSSIEIHPMPCGAFDDALPSGEPSMSVPGQTSLWPTAPRQFSSPGNRSSEANV